MTDLNKLDYSQLRELASQVAQHIAVAHKQEVKRAGEQIEKLAKSLDMGVTELLEATGLLNQKAKRQAGAGSRKAPALYQNPENASETYSGRGRKPFWLVKYLEGGGELENLRIAH